MRDEAPQQWFVCDACHGEGEHPACWGYEDAQQCGKCGGEGGRLGDAEHDSMNPCPWCDRDWNCGETMCPQPKPPKQPKPTSESDVAM